MIDVRDLDPNFLLDIRYATKENFTKERVYKKIQPLLREDAAQALCRVNAKLKRSGLQLKLWDAYRPKQAQKLLWSVFPDERYVANPKKHPRHCEGIAVDLTLADLKGRELPMPTGYDEFSDRAHRNFKKIPKARAANRKFLEKTMRAEGFEGLPTEWWHFDYRS